MPATALTHEVLDTQSMCEMRRIDTPPPPPPFMCSHKLSICRHTNTYFLKINAYFVRNDPAKKLMA